MPCNGQGITIQVDYGYRYACCPPEHFCTYYELAPKGARRTRSAPCRDHAVWDNIFGLGQLLLGAGDLPTRPDQLPLRCVAGSAHCLHSVEHLQC